jgi:hypothetical protein
MNTLAKTQEPTTTGNISITEDAIVFGMFAAHYANAGGSIQCQPGWGADVRTVPVSTFDETEQAWYLWVVSPGPEDGKSGPMGLHITKIKQDGTNKQKRWWAPLETFTKATLTFEGVVTGV